MRTTKKCRWSGGAAGGPGRRSHPEIIRLGDMAQVARGRGEQIYILRRSKRMHPVVVNARVSVVLARVPEAMP
jgi:hypothetical protein